MTTSGNNIQNENLGTPRNTWKVSKVHRNISKFSRRGVQWPAGLSRNFPSRQFMKSEGPHHGSLGMNIGCFLNKTSASLSYTLWGHESFPQPPYHLLPHFLKKLQKQKHSISRSSRKSQGSCHLRTATHMMGTLEQRGLRGGIFEGWKKENGPAVLILEENWHFQIKGPMQSCKGSVVALELWVKEEDKIEKISDFHPKFTFWWQRVQYLRCISGLWWWTRDPCSSPSY